MSPLTPAFLLQNPDLVRSTAPWCVALDNLELSILLLTQPWMVGDGLRRADLERQLDNLRTELPVGPVYFQRIKRAVAKLEQIDLLETSGGGRSKSFRASPRGFAAFVLNQLVLRLDPTIDGREFELKRTIASMWNLVLERMVEISSDLPVDRELDRFLDQVESLTVLGEAVIDRNVIDEALDILRLIAAQRAHVDSLRESTEALLQQTLGEASLLRGIDLSRLAGAGFGKAAALLREDFEAQGMIRGLAAGALPYLGMRAKVLRYQHYLGYLEGLRTMYASELQ